MGDLQHAALLGGRDDLRSAGSAMDKQHPFSPLPKIEIIGNTSAYIISRVV
jgi:hypothetical protein